MERSGLRRNAMALMAGVMLCACANVTEVGAFPAADDDCPWLTDLFDMCLETEGTAETNEDYFLLKAATPCDDTVMSFYPGASHKLFRWTNNAGALNPAKVQALVPDKVRLEFKAQHGDLDLHHGVPNFWMPDTSAESGQASYDLMDLQERGITEWRWRLTDYMGEPKMGTAQFGETPRDIMVSNWCSFSLDFSDPVGAQTKDEDTGAFPSAGNLKALSPCGGAVRWVTSASPKEPFTYSAIAPNGVVMEFLRDGESTWSQVPKAIAGALPKDKVDVNLYELMNAADNEKNWQWRITDPSNNTHGNACAFEVRKGISADTGSGGGGSGSSAPPPPPPSGPPGGFTEQAPYAGNCAQRPQGTVCVAFSDGYIWLVSDSILKQEDRGTVDGKNLRVAVGAKAEYQHLSGTKYVRQVNK